MSITCLFVICVPELILRSRMRAVRILNSLNTSPPLFPLSQALRRAACCAVAVSLGSVAVASAGGNNQLYSEIHSNTYSDIAPIDQFFDDLRGPQVTAGDYAFTTNTLAVGQTVHVNDNFGGLRVELFTRLDYYLSFTPDTAELFWADKNDVPLDQARTYNVFLDANHVKAHGLKLGYLGETDHFTYQIDLSYLYAYEMLVGTLQGDLNGLGSDAEGALLLDYFYSEDKFFRREPSGLSARGLSLDVGFQWAVSEAFDIEFKSKDFYSRIFWNDQDFTSARASSQRVRFDDDGLLEVSPALSWLETERSLRQRLPLQVDLREKWHMGARDTLALRQYAYDKHVFHRITYQHRFFANTYTRLSYDFTTRAKGLALQTRYFHLRVEADDADTELAQHLSVSLGLYLPY